MKKITTKKLKSAKERKLVLFDIDGTLIRSKKPVGHFDHAFKKVLGKEIIIDWSIVPGNIDRKIILELGKKIGLDELFIRSRFDQIYNVMCDYYIKKVTISNVDDYYELLNEAIHLVTHLSNQVHLGLLTGNFRPIAKYKMSLIKLNQHFEFGLYGNEAENRIELAKQTFSRARDFFGIDFTPEQIVVIGDTPQDVSCGLNIQANTIAVATGRHSHAQLMATKADLVVQNLADARVLPFILKS